MQALFQRTSGYVRAGCGAGKRRAVLNDNGHIYLTYGWGLGMDTHAPLMKLVMPAVMGKIFNKTVVEIKAEEPLSILGANLVEFCEDTLTYFHADGRLVP